MGAMFEVCTITCAVSPPKQARDSTYTKVSTPIKSGLGVYTIALLPAIVGTIGGAGSPL